MELSNKDQEDLSTGLQLSPRVRKFIRLYAGDIVSAMREAGYVGDDTKLRAHGRDLLRQPKVQVAIRELAAIKASEASMIAKKDEIQSFLTDTMRNEDPNFISVVKDGVIVEKENIAISSRLKAAELLGKSQGIYSENVNISGTVSIMDVVKKATLSLDDDDLDIDAIEAQYVRVQEHKEVIEKNEPHRDPFFSIDEIV